MSIAEIGDQLRLQPRAWQDIPEPARIELAAELMPRGAFTDTQRYYLARWWLACTQAEVDAINAVLPSGTRVGPVEVRGQLYLGGDLLTDALAPGSTYHPALPLLERLVCTFIEPEDIAAASVPDARPQESAP